MSGRTWAPATVPAPTAARTRNARRDVSRSVMLFLLVFDLKFKAMQRIHRKGASANGSGEITISSHEPLRCRCGNRKNQKAAAFFLKSKRYRETLFDGNSDIMKSHQ